MEFQDIIKYVLSRLTNTTAWIGVIGFILYIFAMHTILLLLFAALFLIPEKDFSGIFASWTEWLRKSTN